MGTWAQEHSQPLPGTGGSCLGWGFSPPTSGSAWKDSREVTAAQDLRAAASCSCTEVKVKPRERAALTKAPQGVSCRAETRESQLWGPWHRLGPWVAPSSILESPYLYP